MLGKEFVDGRVEIKKTEADCNRYGIGQDRDRRLTVTVVMNERSAQPIPKFIDRESPVSGHEQQKKSGAGHEHVKTAVEIPLHGREIYKDDPKQIITEGGELITVADNDHDRNQPPQP